MVKESIEYERSVIINFRDSNIEQEVFADVLACYWSEDFYFFRVIMDEEYCITYSYDVIHSTEEIVEEKKPKLKLVDK